jgi:hypothetical protein
MAIVIVPQAVAQIQIVVRKTDTIALSYTNSYGESHLFVGNLTLNQLKVISLFKIFLACYNFSSQIPIKLNQ